VEPPASQPASQPTSPLMGVSLFCSNCANSHGSFKSFVLSWKEGREEATTTTTSSCTK
jgi:hypothetical protein